MRRPDLLPAELLKVVLCHPTKVLQCPVPALATLLVTTEAQWSRGCVCFFRDICGDLSCFEWMYPRDLWVYAEFMFGFQSNRKSDIIKLDWIPKSWRETAGKVNNHLSHHKQIKTHWYFLSLQSAWKLSLTSSLTTKIHHVSFKSTPFKFLISNECLWMSPGIFEYKKTSPTYFHFLQKCFEPNRNTNTENPCHT